MNNIKTTPTATLIVQIILLLMVSINAYSLEQIEQEPLNKKDIVDEISRSEITDDEMSQAPKLNNIVPAFEMPNFKENIKDSQRESKSSRTTKPEIKQAEKPLPSRVTKPEIKQPEKLLPSRVTKPEVKQLEKPLPSRVTKSEIKQPEKPFSKKEPVLEKAPENKVEKKTQPVSATVKSKRTKKLITIRKPLKTSEVLVNDTIVLKNNRTVIKRTKGKYIYKYRYIKSIPLDSKGIKKLSENNYLVTDKAVLLADLNKTTDTIITLETKGLSEEILLKRKAIEKKHNQEKLISSSISSSKLKRGDIVYTFGEVQMVKRKTSRSFPAKKYWLYPIMDVKNRALLKTGKSKYKVVNKVK